MRRKIAGVLFLALIVFCFSAGAAFGKTITVTGVSGGYTVDIDGVVLKSDVAPRIENSVTLVPMRVIFEALDAAVNYDQTTKTISAVRDNTRILLTLDSKTAYVDGVAKNLDVPAKAVDGRTLVPLRFVGEALGEQVNYVAGSGSAVASYEEVYYVIAQNMIDAMGYDEKGLTCLKTAYTYNQYYQQYGDLEFLSGAQSQYKVIPGYVKYAVENIEKAIANCGSFSQYTKLKATLQSIKSQYATVSASLSTYSTANLDKAVDCYLEISELWNTATADWTAQKPQ